MGNRKKNRHHKKKSRMCTPCTDTCPVRLVAVNNDNFKMQCGHVFHAKYINTWFNQQRNNSQQALEQELTLFLINNANKVEAPFCAEINGTIACDLGESAKFSCPV